MKKLLVMLMCIIMLISMMPTMVFASTGEVPVNDFLAQAVDGVILVEEDTTVSGTLVLDDGKDYEIVLDNCNLHFNDIEDCAIVVKDSTLKITLKDYSNYGESYISSNGSYTLKLDGDKDKTVVNIEDNINVIPSGDGTILIVGGTLNSKGNLLSGFDEPNKPKSPIKVENTNNANVAITEGVFDYDVVEFIPSGYSMNAWVDGGIVHYAVLETPKTVEETVYDNWLLYKGENGYYYDRESDVEFLGVKATKLGNMSYVIHTWENGTYEAVVEFPVVIGDSIEKAYKLYQGDDLREDFLKNGGYEGYHFVGWYEVEIDENTGNLVYSNNKVDVKAANDKEVMFATKWCNDTKTAVTGKAEATYVNDGYTGDTVCASCGLVYKNGEVVPKLLKVEEQKVEVTEKVVEEVVKNATSSKADTVVIPLADAKEEIKVVELPTKAVEKVVESGKSLTVETPTATVTLDNKALETVIAKAEGAKIELQIKAVKETELLPAQKDALKDVKADLIISAEIVCATTGKEISKDFGGGKATVALPFQAEAGTKLEDYVVIYIADDGTIQKVPTKVVDGKLVFDIEHFSEYAVVKKEVVKEEVVKDIPFVNGTPETGDTNSMLPWIVLMVATATGITVLKRKED